MCSNRILCEVFLLPHELFADMYESDPECFETFVRGSDEAIHDFWRAVDGTVQFRGKAYVLMHGVII